ncbi:MAG: Rrf2 family transcriptional regulator [Hyphomicrobium sp.]|jgi:Rrf2 family nitric oxide-sensitive transcriptional repressor|uniref:Rrf2 family transcriptional regulator n=1 Tax=Hyphomicrobium sp. TaxID=82 RepID=UPI0025C1EFCD|nr:Rrf2 family transcriptional regulator [Hyphomicrobium sp.]MBX9863905.1 Rrf2 family transcriptional regulator [Hyphomicrobium sp.]
MFVVSRAFVALRILNYVAMCPDGIAKKGAIAKGIAAPEPYTGKIVHELLMAGFITSVRGRQGGYALAQPASSIRVGDVVQFVEDTRSWRTRTDPVDTCMRDALKDARDKFFQVLNEHSIADLGMLNQSATAGAYVGGLAEDFDARAGDPSSDRRAAYDARGIRSAPQ